MLAPLPPNAASYLAAVSAACVYIGPGPTIGADVRLPRQAVWAAWCKDVRAAQKVATPDLLVRVADDGVRVGRSVEQLAAAIEQRAKQLHVTLTAHSVAVERALKLAMRVDQTLATLQQRGDMAAFNRAYRQHRLQAQARGEKFIGYPAAAATLRAVVIRCLANTDRETLNASALHFALQAELPWYRVGPPEEHITRV
jgi:hypothetical protein